MLNDKRYITVWWACELWLIYTECHLTFVTFACPSIIQQWRQTVYLYWKNSRIVLAAGNRVPGRIGPCFITLLHAYSLKNRLDKLQKKYTGNRACLSFITYRVLVYCICTCCVHTGSGCCLKVPFRYLKPFKLSRWKNVVYIFFVFRFFDITCAFRIRLYS